MNQQSAAKFPGESRLHIALEASDVERSKQFYRLLLGVEPSKERPGYVKFEPVDPSVNLTLNQRHGAAAGHTGSAHYGVQVKSVAAVHDAVARFQAADYETVSEEQTTCCYALQDKVWVSDPDGNRWEVFVVLEADVKDQLYAEAGCCVPEVTGIQLSGAGGGCSG